MAIAPGHSTWSTPSRTTIRWLSVLLLWLLAGYIVWRESMVRFWWDRASLDWQFNPLVKSVGLDRVLMPIVLLGHYAALLVIPVRLSIDYGAMVIGSNVNYADPYLYAGIAAGLLSQQAYIMSAEPMLELGDYAGAKSAVDEGLQRAP